MPRGLIIVLANVPLTATNVQLWAIGAHPTFGMFLSSLNRTALPPCLLPFTATQDCPHSNHPQLHRSRSPQFPRRSNNHPDSANLWSTHQCRPSSPQTVSRQRRSQKLNAGVQDLFVMIPRALPLWVTASRTTKWSKNIAMGSTQSWSGCAILFQLKCSTTLLARQN